MSDAPSESEAQCRSAQGKSSTLSPATAPEMLALKVTPGLQQEQISTPISLCHDFLNGVIKWRLTQTMWF
jgi:hypothetical protein